MKALRDSERAVLDVFEIGTGAMAMPLDLVRRFLTERNHRIEDRTLYRIMGRFQAARIITKVRTSDRGTMYVRTAALNLAPGRVWGIANTPARQIPHRSSSTTRRIENAETRQIHKWQDEIVRRSLEAEKAGFRILLGLILLAAGAPEAACGIASRATSASCDRTPGNGTSRARSCPTNGAGRGPGTVRGRERTAEAQRTA